MKTLIAIAATCALCGLAHGETLDQFGHTVKHDAHHVGKAAVQVGKRSGHAVVHAAKVVGHDTVHAAKVVGHDTAHAAKVVGHAVASGARHGYDATRREVHKLTASGSGASH